MIESPVLKELIADFRQKDIIKVLVTGFWVEANELERELKTVEEDQLDKLLEHAVTCPDLDPSANNSRDELPPQVLFNHVAERPCDLSAVVDGRHPLSDMNFVLACIVTTTWPSLPISSNLRSRRHDSRNGFCISVSP